MNEFNINKIRVDADRCRIFRDDHEFPLEPKVAQVLVFLARHCGEVVTHQTLLDAIWTNTVVEPSALQRCIAQLRKALGDDARQQRIIATYPKRGYSLVADVSWKKDKPAQPSEENRQWVKPALAFAVAASLVLAVALTSMSLQNQSAPVENVVIDNEQEQTGGRTLQASQALQAAITDPDDFPVYSPDGRYVVYPRYLEERKAHLWARDLAYGNDFLLTEDAGIYEHLAWSRDSSQLVFVDASCILAHCEASQCASLKSVSISQSETNILSVRKLIDCSTSRLLSPEWLGPRELSVIEVSENEAALVRFDLDSPKREVLYQSRDLMPYHLSYSRQTGTLTIMAINTFGRKELLFLDTRSGTINHNDTAVFLPDENWYPSAAPL